MDELERVIALDGEREAQALTNNVPMSLDVDSTRRLKAEHLAAVLGEQDVQAVEENLEFLERSARNKGLYERLPANSPSRKILSDPLQLHLQADVERLANIEESGFWTEVKKAASRGWNMVESGETAYDNMWVDRATYDQAMREHKAQQLEDAPANPDPTGFLENLVDVPLAATELGAQIASTLLEPESLTGIAASVAGKRVGGRVLGLMGKAGAVLGPGGEMFKMEAGHAFDEFRDMEGVDEDAARGGALIVGTINASLEYVGVTQLARLPQILRLAGPNAIKQALKHQEAQSLLSRFAKEYAAGMSINTAQEILQELTNVIVGKVLQGEGALVFTREDASRVLQAGEKAAKGSLLLGLPGAGVVTAQTHGVNKQLEQRTKMFKALSEDINNSELFQNSPEKAKEFIRAVQERHGTVDTLYMEPEEARTLFQNIDDFAELMPETAASLAEATVTGARVAIPMDEFVQYVAPSADLATIMEDIAYGEREPTPRQIEEQKAEFERVLQEYQETQAIIDSADDPIYGRAYAELLAAGQEPQVAESGAEIFTRMVRMAALQRRGVDPMDIAGKIDIRGELVGAESIDIPTYTGGLLNMLREGKAPSQRDVFGESLVEYLIGLGGLEDVGGELSARDLDKAQDNYGRRRLARDGGLPLSEAFERARDAGYISGQLGDYASEDAALLAAIDNELAGNPVFAQDRMSPAMEELNHNLESLQRALDEAGIDLATMDNQEVMDRLGITELTQADGLLWFHGTDVAFEQFQVGTGMMGPGVYLSTEKSASEKYARGEVIGKGTGGNPRIIEARIRGELLDAEALTYEQELEIYRRAGLNDAASDLESMGPDGYVPDLSYFFEQMEQYPDAMVPAIQGMGFVGITANEAFDRGGVRDGTQYRSAVVFDPANIEQNTGRVLYQSVSLRAGRETLKRFGLDPKKKYKTREVAAALEARQRRKFGSIDRKDRSSKAARRVADWMVQEVLFEMENPEASGVGWYSEKFQRALDIMADQFLELKNDKTARNTMTAIIAITSDGQKVVPNFAQAMDIYGNFRDTGQFTTTRGHQRQASIDNNLKTLQRLHDQMGADAMHEYLMQEMSISELKKIAKENGGELKSDYQAHISMPMAAVEFGPKLGAFYANLMGAHGYLTMDRWWSRTFNRYRGTLLQAPTQDGLKRFRELLGEPGLSDDETIARTVEPRNAYAEKKFKDGTEIEVAANTIYKAAFEDLEDAPFSATDRTFMLDAVNKAQATLSRKGYNLSIADIQAILWYYEKRLYGELGARATADISYEEAARRVVAGYAGGPGGKPVSDQSAGAPVDGGESAQRVPVGEEEYGSGESGRVKPTRTLYQQASPEGSSAFNLWAEGQEPIDPEDINDTDFREGQTYVMRVFHGTTHDFSEFQSSKRGMKDGHFGAINYFTSSEYDAEHNYAGEGPDLTNRIERRAEQLESMDDMDPQDAMAQARSELAGGNDQVLEVYVKTNNPFVVDVGNPGATPWTELFNLDMDAAAESVAGSYGITAQEAMEQYEDEVYDEAYALADGRLQNAIDIVAEEMGFSPNALLGNIYDLEYEVSHGQLEAVLRQAANDSYLEDPESGDLIANHVVSRIIEEMGYDAIILKNADQQFSSMNMDRGTVHVHVFDQYNSNIKSVNNAGTFNPADSNIYRQGPRGYLQITPDRLTITLTKNANFSTFIHEVGHLGLELMQESLSLDTASDQLRADWEILKDYLGIEGDTITTEQHEKFARSFEAYLMEGRAPSKDLAAVFKRFKTWLLSIYKTVRNLDVELSDEVRGVMDRMLVAEASIEHAAQDITPAFEGAEAALTPEEMKLLLEMKDQAILAGEEEMEQRAIAEIRKLRQKEYRERKKALTETVTAEVDAQPVYAVQRLLRTGDDANMTVPEEVKGKKLDSHAVIDLFADTGILRRLPGLTRKTNAVHPDVLAELYGFESGYRMVQDIVAAPKRTDVIKNRVQEQLDAEFGNMAQDVETIERAAAALHNDKMANYLEAEARAINKRLGGMKWTPMNQAMKAAAKKHIAGLAIRNIRPHSYYQAELKAAREAQEAVARGDWEKAALYKRRQLLNHHLYREARTAAERAETIRRKLLRFNSPKAMQRIRKGDPAAADAINALLEKVELKRVSNKKLDARARILQYVGDKMQAGEPVQIDPELYADAKVANWRGTTLAYLEMLDSSVQALAKQGRDAHKVKVAGEAIDAELLVNELDAIASTNMDRKDIDHRSRDNRHPIVRGLATIGASLRKIEFEVRMADGDIAGHWHKAIFQPFVDAQNAKEEMLQETVERLQEIMSGIDRKHARHLDQDVEFLGHKMKRGDLYVVVLNMGSQSNMDRLFSRDWKGREAEALAKLQEQLTLEDFRRIEALGQLIDEFYEPMAAVSERVDGIRPPKVEATPLHLDKYGVTLSGWYYPVKYKDAPGSNEQAAVANGVEMGPSPIHGQVSRSMTKDRQEGAQGIIDLDFSHFATHMNQVVHYITHYEQVRNLDKLRKRDDFREMYEGYFGVEGYEALRAWLQNIATNGKLAQDVAFGVRAWAPLLRYARFGMSMLGLGWKVSSAAIQTLGAGPAAKEVGPVRMATWLARLSAGRGLTMGQAKVHPDYQRAMDNSPELRHLDKQIDRDVREITDTYIEVMRAPVYERAARWLQANSFYMLIAVQKHINAATWLAAFEKAQEEGRSADDSTMYADAVVRQTQSGGGLKDLAGVQHASELTKILTLFYTYFSVQHNQLRMTGRQDLLKGFIRGDGPHGRLVSLQKFVTANMLIVIGPALVEAILKYDEDDDEEKLPYLADRVVSTYMAGIPVARDAYRAAMTNYATPATPIDSMIATLVKGGGSLADVVAGDMNHTDVRNIARATTLVTRIPVHQATMVYEAAGTADGFDEFISHLFFGTPYSEIQDDLL